MKNLVFIITSIFATFLLYVFEGSNVTAKTESETSSDMPPTNFSGADLTGANLNGASLDGVILCNTTMLDGTINNTSCKN